MALFEVTGTDSQVYREELQGFLPDKITDIHTHIWLKSLRPPRVQAEGQVKRTVTWPSLVAEDNSLEDLEETYRLLFPGKQVSPLLFASADRDSLDACNDYVRDASRRSGHPALYYSHPNQSADELEQRLREGGFLGLKSYLDLAPDYLPEAEIRIYDFFPRHQLERMNALGAMVMLHIPRHGRLKDPVNLAQMIEIRRDFPDIRLIIAHIGRAYTRQDVGDAFRVLKAAPGLYFDFSANTCQFAMARLLEAVGPGQVLFGSDLPILRMRTRRIEEGGTYINLVPPGLYGDPRQDSHLREVSREEGRTLTFFMYEELLAFKRAARETGLTQEEIRAVFNGNAQRLISGARRDLYSE